MTEAVRCMGCGGAFSPTDGPTHPYMTSVPGCWATFGVVLGREFGGWWMPEVHRLTVDTYAVQHPGGEDRRAVQSVALHLVALHLALERDVGPQTVRRVLSHGAGGVVPFTRLAPPYPPGERTVLHVAAATDAEDHAARVRSWAASAWTAWADHHALVRDWAGRLLGP